jgi:NAD(P)-dependent dehydrogenase (short-subunit alcohol dehydrogenase family)
MMDLKGKIIVLTGATSGIGKVTACELGAYGANLVLPVRDMMKGENLKQEIEKKNPQANVDIFHCDLASFESIRSFVSRFRKNYQQLHVLVNNAGVWETKRKLSVDGIEMHFAVNHLAPFLLTNLLLDIIIKSSPSRIINTSSNAHRRARLQFEDIEFSKKYSHIMAYSQSKLANILFTKKLSQKLRSNGTTVNCFNPGLVNTAIFDSMPFIKILMRPFMKSPEKGAQTLIHLCISPELSKISGEYFENKKPGKPNHLALRKDVADRLWKISEKYIGMQ